MRLKSKPIVQLLAQFYSDYQKGGETKEKYFRALMENSGWSKSTFLKFYAGKHTIKVEIYRDDGRGGPYSLRHAEILD